MTYAEFVHHIAFHQEFPWGDDWRQTQALHATMMNCSPKYRTFSLDKYFPSRSQRNSKPQSGDYIFGMFRQMARDAEARRKVNRGNVR